jgi:YD repeat-containing protein
LREAFGTDSIPRMRQREIGTKPASTDVFQVDSDGRVTGENLLLAGITLPNGEINNSDVELYLQQGASRYVLDKIGNIKKKNTVVHEVDELSRLTAIGGRPVAHDATDNLNGRQNDPVHFAFDQFARTVVNATSGAGTARFEYDALDRRRVEHRPDGTNRVFIWDGNQLVGHGPVYNLSLDVPGDDIDAHVASINQFGSQFYHQGQDQSTLAVTGSTGLVESYTYSAFGELSIWKQTGNRNVSRRSATSSNIRGRFTTH